MRFSSASYDEASEQPKYSLVIAAYNVEKYLPSCLDSILSQAYSNYEIVIVNDGSTDCTLQICDAFCRTHPDIPIVVIDQSNAGAFMAKRVGFKKARGEYIWSIDGDDLIRPGALELIDSTISATQADMVFFEYSLMPDYSIPHHKLCFPTPSFFGSNTKSLIFEAYCKGNIFPLATKVVRKKCFRLEKDCLQYDGLCNGDDQLQVLDILNEIESAAYINEALYFYRQNTESITGKYRKGILADHDLVMEAQIVAIQEWSEKYHCESLEQIYKAAMLRSLFFNCRRCLKWANRTSLLNELRDIEYYGYLVEGIHDLRDDQKLFYWLVDHRCDVLAVAVCAIMRFLLGVKNKRTV